VIKINLRGVIMNNKHKKENNEKYRFGMGIEFIDTNVISGPDIERAINNEMIGNESSSNDESKKNS
jgi:hypothetical protein